MKKTLALLLAIVTLFLLCACAGNPENTTTNDTYLTNLGTTGAIFTTGAAYTTAKPHGTIGTTVTTGVTTNATTNATTIPEIPEEDKVNILNISGFCGELARVSTNTGYGYINKNGKIVIEPIYEEAQEYFEYELAKVCKDGIYMFIDKTGKVIFEADFEYVALGDYVNGAFWLETKEETIDGAVHTMAYYTYNGTMVTKAFSVNAKNAGEDSNFYVPYETTPNDKYALVHITEDDGYGEDGVFIDFEGNKVELKGIDKGDSIGSWHREWGFVSSNVKDNYGMFVHINFEYKEATRMSVRYDENEYIGYGRYCVDGGVWGDAYDYGDMIILRPLFSYDYDIINVSDIPTFSNAIVKKVMCGYDEWYTVYLMSSSGVYFSSVIDRNGSIIMSPTKDISLGKSLGGNKYECYTFSSNYLCKAKDEKTGLFGFININGEWAIEPQFQSVTDFSNGYNPVAVVDGKAVINSRGEVLYSVDDWSNEVVSSLDGKYVYNTYSITFTEDGSLMMKETNSAGSMWVTGAYSIKGTEITISGISSYIWPYRTGTYDFHKNGNKITIGKYTWTLSE